MAETLRERIAPYGFHRDVRIPEAVFEQHRDELHATDRALYDAPSFRDGAALRSVHVTDHRQDGTCRDGIITHLEWFNPEHHPIVHLLVEFPLWVFWNRCVYRRMDAVPVIGER